MEYTFIQQETQGDTWFLVLDKSFNFRSIANREKLSSVSLFAENAHKYYKGFVKDYGQIILRSNGSWMTTKPENITNTIKTKEFKFPN